MSAIGAPSEGRGDEQRTRDPWSFVVEMAEDSRHEPAAPIALASPGEATRDRFVGTMLGGAIGDALGRPVERWARDDVRASYPNGVREFEPWKGWSAGPIGTITDDTQLSLAVAGWLRDAGEVSMPDGADFGRRVAEWGPVARGAGIGSLTAASNLAEGMPWWQSGSPTYGNGVAMRSAAIGLRYQGEAERIRTAVAISGITTHRHPSAIAGGLVMASVTSYLLALPVGSRLDPESLLGCAWNSLRGLNLPRHPRGASEQEWSLDDLIRSVRKMLYSSLDDVLDYYYNGSAIFQSLPVALWLFCVYGDGDTEELLVAATSGGRDADTIAAMVGNWAGALHGTPAFPERWNGPELEFRDELTALASDLYDLWEGARHVEP